MIRCVRIWTGEDGGSCFEEGAVDMADTVPGGDVEALSISFRETQVGGTFAPHDTPIRQYVVTLSGTLEFKTATGETVTIQPGDVLLAEDATGSGHSWHVVGDRPWRRACIILAPGVSVPFVKVDRRRFYAIIAPGADVPFPKLDRHQT